MKKIKCDKCGFEFSNRGGNFLRHYDACSGNYKNPESKGICIHCNEFFDLTTKSLGWMANHSRWCKKNPMRDQYNKNTEKMRAGITEESKKKCSISISLAHAEGKYDHIDRKTFLGKTHTDKTKKILRDKALSSPHRRLKKHTVMYNGVLLDSTWELELARRLDSINVKWTRPAPLKWIDNSGIEHHYFPDFYLPEHNLYLDPKNPHAFKVQKEKLDILLTQYNNIVIITTLQQCKEFSI